MGVFLPAFLSKGTKVGGGGISATRFEQIYKGGVGGVFLQADLSKFPVVNFGKSAQVGGISDW